MPLTTLTKVSSKQLDTATLSMSRLSDVDLSTPPTTGQTVIWNGTKFIAGASFSASDFNTAFSAKTTSNLSEGTNLYFTNTRARNAVSATGSISYNSSTGVFSFTQGDTDTITEGISNLYFTTARARNAVSAVGSISYNSSTGVFSFTQGNTDTVSEGTTNLYFTTARARSALSAGTGISYNGTTGAISSSITQYTDALARAAISAGSNITYSSSTGVISLSSANVTGALGFTPYNATNPSGYTSNTGTVTSVGGTGTVSGLTLTGSVTTTGNLTLGGTLSLTSSQVTTALGFTPSAAVTVKDEGSSLTTSVSSIDFVGAGVTATTSGNNVTVTIPGGGGGGSSGTTTNALTIGPGLASNNTEDLIYQFGPVDNSTEMKGTSVATNGTYSAVSAPYGGSSQSGYVYVYRNSDGALCYRINLTTYNLVGYYRCGIAMYGNYLAVGADPNGYGKVYLFDMSTWSAYSGSVIDITSATVTLSNPANQYGSFGSAIALSSSYLVVGAPGNNSTNGAGTAGMAYLYTLTGTLKYMINGPAASGNYYNNLFGSSVAIFGHYLVIGAPYETNSSGYSAGKAYIYNTSTLPTYSGSTVTIPKGIDSSSGNGIFSGYGIVLNNPTSNTYTNETMGMSVATNGIYVVVGATGATDSQHGGTNVNNAGAVYVFNADSGAFVSKIYAPNPYSGVEFGTSVVLASNTILVSGSHANSNGPPGAVYVYSTSDFKLRKVIETYNPAGFAAADKFGSSISAYGNYALIGAPYEQAPTQGYNTSGAAYYVNINYTFDGSSAASVALAKSPVTPGIYGGTDGYTYVNVPQISVDRFGRVLDAKHQQFTVAQGLDHAFSAIMVNGSEAFTASSADSVNFQAGTNVTIASSINGQGVKTITINSTGGSSGGGGGAGGPASYFSMTLVSLSPYSQFTLTLPSGATSAPCAVSLINPMYIGGNPGDSLVIMEPNWQPLMAYGGGMSPFNMYASTGPHSGTSLQVSNNSMASATIKLMSFVLDISSTTQYYQFSGAPLFSNGPSCLLSIYLQNQFMTPGYIYGFMTDMNGGSTSSPGWSDLSSLTAAPGVTLYVDNTNGAVWFRAPPSAWTAGNTLMVGTFGSFSYNNLNVSYWVFGS